MAYRRRARPRRTWPQRFGLLLGVLVAAASVVAIVGLNYANSKADELTRVALGPVLGEEVSSSEPKNFLIVGVDSAERLDPDSNIRNERGDTELTDTLMLLRVDPESNEAFLLSFPRDLVVTIADAGYEDRINTAQAVGGPEVLVRTIEDNFDVPINHYLEVDFKAFIDLVDALGGVPLWIDHPVRDPRVGLQIDVAGCHTFTPDESLAYVRSRSLEQFVDGEWQNLDLTPDLARIQRQQDFVVAALQRAVNKGARNLGVLNDLVNVGLANLAVDERLTPGDILDLGGRFRTYQPETLVKLTPPVYDDLLRDSQVLRLQDGPEAQEIFDVFRGVDGRSLDPASIRVAVSNGTGEPGLGSAVATGLESAGFAVVGFGDAESFDFEATVLRTTESGQPVAEALGRWLPTDPEIVLVDALAAGEVDLVVGADFAGLLSAPRAAPTPTPAPTGEAAVATPEPAPAPSVELEADEPTVEADGADGNEATPDPAPTPEPRC